VQNVSHGAEPDHEQAKLGLGLQALIFSQGRVFLIGHHALDAEVGSGTLAEMGPLGPVTSKCVDCSGSSQNFTLVRHATRDEIFFSGPDRNPLTIDDQGVTALHNDHVFVVIVGVGSGCSGLTAGPKCHLASICSIEDKALYAWSRLIGLRDLIGGMPHELGKIFHGCG
jgi:hypothetical protein